MHGKIFSFHHGLKLKATSTGLTASTAKLVHRRHKRNQMRPYVRIKLFVHDYSLPLVMTVIFLLLVLFASFVRAAQQSSLADLLAGITDAGKEYGTFISTDKTDDLKKNSDTGQPAAGTTAGTPSSFAVNPNAGGGSSPAPAPASPGGGTGTTAPPPAPFTASIAYFRQDSAALECTTPKPKKQTCSKRYVFGAGIRTQNGPGTVNYGWRSNLPSAIEAASMSAGSGEAVTPLSKAITLACTSPSTFTLQLALLLPAQVLSANLSVNHNCNEI